MRCDYLGSHDYLSANIHNLYEKVLSGLKVLMLNKLVSTKNLLFESIHSITNLCILWLF